MQLKMTCKKCDFQLKKNSKFCSNCGEKVIEKTLCICGEELKSTDNFCFTCGESVQNNHNFKNREEDQIIFDSSSNGHDRLWTGEQIKKDMPYLSELNNDTQSIDSNLLEDYNKLFKYIGEFKDGIAVAIVKDDIPASKAGFISEKINYESFAKISAREDTHRIYYYFNSVKLNEAIPNYPHVIWVGEIFNNKIYFAAEPINSTSDKPIEIYEYDLDTGHVDLFGKTYIFHQQSKKRGTGFNFLFMTTIERGINNSGTYNNFSCGIMSYKGEIIRHNPNEIFFNSNYYTDTYAFIFYSRSDKCAVMNYQTNEVLFEFNSHFNVEFIEYKKKIYVTDEKYYYDLENKKIYKSKKELI